MSSGPADRALLPPPGAPVYLLGIAGAGMSGLAMLLAADGYRVTGSDRELTPESRRLEALGVRLVPESDPQPATQVALLVHTSAAPADHPVLAAARAAGVPVIKRARATGALLNERHLTAVAGTHGKTTVTAMTARVAEAGGLDPIALVGGHVADWGGNARYGGGRTAVVEADEFDRSFLELDPSLAVVTSLEPEHMECYEDEADLESSFRTFAGRAESRDGILACADAPGALAAVHGLASVRTYGFSEGSDYRVEVLRRHGLGQTCRLVAPTGAFDFELGVPGRHNAQNAGAAMAAGLRLDIETTALRGALADFSGVDRRLQVLKEGDGRVIVDDYAHHPTEVAASMSAARDAWPGRPLAVVFQPHLYSRTRAMATEFAAALSGADAAVVLPIYPARELPIPGVTAGLIVRAASGSVGEVSAENVSTWVAGLRDDAVVLFMGAGDVTRLAHRVAGDGGTR